MSLRLCLAVLLGLLSCIARAQDAAEKPMDDDAYVQEALNTKLPQFEKDRLTIVTAMEFLSKMGKVNIYVEDAALTAAGYDVAATPVFVTAKNITLRECINRTVKSFEKPDKPLRWVVESGVVILSTTTDKNWAAIPEAANKFGETDAFKAEQVINELSFEGTALGTVLGTMRDNGINVYVHWGALKQHSLDVHNRINLTLNKVRPRTAMQLLVRRLAGPTARLSYVIHDGVWVISTPKDLERQKKLWDWRPHNIADQETANKLANVLDDVSFNSRPFKEALEDLSRMSEVTMDVNWPSVSGAGVERETQLSFTVKQEKLSTALDLILTEAAGTEQLLDYKGKESTVTIELRKEPEKPATRPAKVLTTKRVVPAN